MTKRSPLTILLILFMMYSVEYAGAVETQFYWLRPGAYAVYVLGVFFYGTCSWCSSGGARIL